jgi:dTDP-4-amino-4,6-dideoxy-D-galactose acyltransferase
MIKKLEWDSDFFNLNVGELDFKDYNNSQYYTDYDLLYVVSPGSFDLKLKGFESSYSEQKIKFHKNLKPSAYLSENIFSFKETEYSIQDLYELAFESGTHSRFFMDKKFTSEKFKELYRLWIDNSISSSFAADILLYKSAGKTIGLLTYKINENNAFAGLFSVSPQHQGKGVGGAMLKHLESILYKKGISNLIIPTQYQNQQACYFYAKQGYSISENTYIKHYWKIK